MSKKITIWYLKWYYWYKNFGDELLALWIIPYLFNNYPLEKLYIEVEDIDRFWTWLQRHSVYLEGILSKVELISSHDKISVIRHSILSPNVHIFLWWWEIFSPARWWFHWGRNMYILYRHQFLRHNVTLLGWVSKANNSLFKLLYRLTLSKSDKIILRDPISYEYIVSNYSSRGKVILYKDFGQAFIDSLDLSTLTEETPTSITRPHCPYVIVNTNPYIDISVLTQMLSKLTVEKNLKTFVYIPWDKEDTVFYGILTDKYRQYDWTYFDWTLYDILSTIDLFRHATFWVAVRLHILAMLQRFAIPYDFIVYQEKIEKFLAMWKQGRG